jgi:16S rRNA (adenine1518-N6/adenine1519-N6)-dimethyltransferase
MTLPTFRNRSEPDLNHDHVQTKQEIQAALADAGLNPQKRFGQNFLTDGNLMRRLVDSADLSPEDWALEIGPGTGGLTDLLLTRAARVIAVEVDRGFQELLTARYADVAHFELIAGDVLSSKHRLHESLQARLDEAAEVGSSVKLVANLPYQVATPSIMNLLSYHPVVSRCCFTVQAEVGDRLRAEPGTRAYGPLSIIVQALCTASVVARLPARVFWPAPQVASVMMELRRRAEPPLPAVQVPAFARFVRRAFDHRRKQARSAFAYDHEAPSLTRMEARFDLTRRPADFTVSEWFDLFRCVSADSDLR